MLERYAEILGRDLAATLPLALQPVPLLEGTAGEPLHELRNEPVCVLHRVTWLIDEPDLDLPLSRLE